MRNINSLLAAATLATAIGCQGESPETQQKPDSEQRAPITEQASTPLSKETWIEIRCEQIGEETRRILRLIATESEAGPLESWRFAAGETGAKEPGRLAEQRCLSEHGLNS